MRDFIICASVPVKAVSLDDLPGSGRIDVLARCVNAALWLSHGVRRDATIHLCFECSGEKSAMSFSGLSIKRVSPDERNIASWIRRGLDAINKGQEQVQEGISVRKTDLAGLVSGFAGRDIVILKENGKDMRGMELKDPVFILGGHLDIPESELKALERFKLKEVSVGPKSLLASHAIALANNEMDRQHA